MTDSELTPFERKLHEVKDLLSREELVINLSKRQQGPRQQVVEAVTRRQQYSKLNSYLDRQHTADVAKLMESLPIADRQHIWNLQKAARGGELLLELSDSVLEHIVQETPPADLREVLKQLDADDLSYISEFIPKEALEKRLEDFSQEEQKWVNTSLHYPSECVGYHMSRDLVVAREHERLNDLLLRIRTLQQLPDHNDRIFVVNHHGIYLGYLPIETLLLQDPATSVGECIKTNDVHFVPEDDAVKAAMAFERYDLISAPVLNERGRLIGRLTVDVVMDILRSESTEDALNSVGLKGEEDLFAPIWNSAKNRWVWLTMSLGTAFLASRVIGMFEQTIIKIVAVAALMPIVAAIGGNTANQTTTLIVRALALEQINRNNLNHVVRKELGLSLLNGVFWGLVVGLFAYIVYQDIHLAQVITLAMVLTLMLAAIFGLSIPLSLHYLKRDPALGSSVLVTALTDSIGFFIFLGLATLFLI